MLRVKFLDAAWEKVLRVLNEEEVVELGLVWDGVLVELDEEGVALHDGFFADAAEVAKVQNVRNLWNR